MTGSVLCSRLSLTNSWKIISTGVDHRSIKQSTGAKNKKSKERRFGLSSLLLENESEPQEG